MSATKTTLKELKANAAAPPVVASGSELSIFSDAGSKLMWGMARAYANSTIVPAEYQGKESNCFIALDMARRLDINPLTVMQQLYIVYERPAWSSQFLIGMFNSNPDFSPLRYKFEGPPGTDDWGCRAMAVDKVTGETLEGTLITIGLAKAEGWFDKKNSKWKTMPEQMLRYRAASWFIRAYAPEQGMGLMTREEVIDMERDHDGVYRITTDDIIFATEDSRGSEKRAEPVEPLRPAIEEPPAAPASAPCDDTPAMPDPEEVRTRPICRTSLDLVEKELKRLGAPGHLPPELAEKFGTGDPSELTELEGQEALRELKKIQL